MTFGLVLVGALASAAEPGSSASVPFEPEGDRAAVAVMAGSESPPPSRADPAASAETGETGLTGETEAVRWRDALRRIELLESRLAEMEASVHGPPSGALSDAVVAEPVTVAGPVVVGAGDVVAEAVGLTGPVDVYGRVRGNAVSVGADVRVHPGGRVEGDAVSLGGRIVVSDGGAVLGDRVALGGSPSAESRTAASAVIGGEGLLTSVTDRAAILGPLRDLARRMAVLLSCAAAGVLVVGFWPRQVDRIAGLVSARPAWLTLLGGLFGVALLLGATVLGLTIIGIPLALLLVLVLAGGGLLGFVGLGKAIGDRFSMVRDRGGWLAFLVGAGLLAGVAFLPWVGPAIIALLMMPALGAALSSGFGNRVGPPGRP
ncbi:MAG: hypothetical protein VX000_14360 [Myxococcota bacterium]|nr:hypothetical protein [Myxococcota bacterium]